MSDESNRLFDIRLDDRNFVARNPEVEHERRVAIYDLLEDNYFRMVDSDNGPYALRLLRQESRLIFEITDNDGYHFADIPLALSTFRNRYGAARPA
jgi:uncharacterized protein (UPF0262 family)